MKYSLSWIQSYINEPLPPVPELTQTVILKAFEVEDIETVGSDTTMEIKVLPDRAHDCLSHYGMAREFCGLFGTTLKPLISYTGESAPTDLSVRIESDQCRRYMGRVITGVAIAPSPQWLVDMLASVGQKSINNIVDATNYVLLGLGHPTHVFDLDRVSGGITVRAARDGESITTLDNKTITLNPSMTVISDGAGNPLALAGVKGGTHAEVSAATTNIILEVANFMPTSTRTTGRGLGLLTDAVKRYENDFSSELSPTAMDVLTALIVDLAGGTVQDIVDVYPHPEASHEVSFTTAYIADTIGAPITSADIATILSQYGYGYLCENDCFVMPVPAHRVDIRGPHDMADEIGRVYGYDRVPARVPQLSAVSPENPEFLLIENIRSTLHARGFSETMTYSFAASGDIEVLAPMAADKSHLRTNLAQGFIPSLNQSFAHADLVGASEIRLFEIGKTFTTAGEQLSVIVGIKRAKSKGVDAELAEIAAELSTLHPMNQLELRDGIVELVCVNPSSFVGSRAPIDYAAADNKFAPWSAYPFMTRDIAVWVPESTDPATLVELYTRMGGELLVRAPRQVDCFSRDGQTSYAYRLVFQSFDRTLTDDEIKPITDRIYAELDKMGYSVR